MGNLERRSRLSDSLQGRLMEHFVAGTTARAASEIFGVQVNTTTNFYMRLRRLIASKLASSSYKIEFQIASNSGSDKSYELEMGGSAEKNILFGLIMDDGNVCTVTRDIPLSTAFAIFETELNGVVCDNHNKDSSVINLNSCKLEKGMNSTFAVENRAKFDGIENFWRQIKRYLLRYNGVKRDKFYWFLKECEWRFNGGCHDQLLTQLKFLHDESIRRQKFENA